MIEFRDVSYSYEENRVLDCVSFRIEKGQCAFLSGPNGAGKSTLLRMVNGIIFPHAGHYFFEGDDISQKRMDDNRYAKKFHQRIGYIWQNPDAQLFCGSVEEEIAFGPEQMGLSDKEIATRVEDALELFHLSDLRRRVPCFLSGGEKKRTAIAAIFAMNPAVWTLDEPFATLDEKTRDWLELFLMRLKEAGKTIIFSSHDGTLSHTLPDMELRLDEAHRLQIIPPSA